MLQIKKLFIFSLAVLLLNYFLSINMFSPSCAFAKAKVTQNDPVIISSPAKTIPVETAEGKKGGTWIWILLGVAAVGGLAAIAMGGSGGDSGGGGSDGGGDTSDDGGIALAW